MNKTEAIRVACLSVRGGDKRWEALRKSGATREEIESEIKTALGIAGGMTSDGGFLSYEGGSSPYIQHSDGWKLSGVSLIDAVRVAFAIPERGQLSLL